MKTKKRNEVFVAKTMVDRPTEADASLAESFDHLRSILEEAFPEGMEVGKSWGRGIVWGTVIGFSQWQRSPEIKFEHESKNPRTRNSVHTVPWDYVYVKDSNGNAVLFKDTGKDKTQ